MNKIFTSLVFAILTLTGSLFAETVPCTCVNVSAIYWTAYADGMEYALYDQAYVNLPIGFYANNFELREANLRPSWGFKLGVERLIRCNAWTIDALWTRFTAQGESRTFRTESGATTGFLGDDANELWLLLDTPGPDSIKGTQQLSYNTLDLSLKKDLSAFANWFCFAFGLKGVIILERLKINYMGTGGYSLGDPKLTIQNDFRGLGPMIGFVPRFPLGCGFSLEGLGAISALWGRFNLNQSQKGTESGVNLIVTREINRIQPNLNLGISLNWRRAFSRFQTELSVGYEINDWINFIRQNSYANYRRTYGGSPDINAAKTVEQRHGDLMLHGLNLSVNVAF